MARYKRGRTYYKKNRSSFRKAGRIVKRRLGPRTQRLMKKIGESLGTKDAKVFQIATDSASGPVARNTRTLYGNNLLSHIAKQGTGDEINMRDSSTINVRGVSIDYLFTSITAKAVIINIALIIPKDLAVLATSIPVDKFFKGYGTSDFQDFTPDLSSHDMSNRALNSDQFDVLWRKKFILGHREDTYSTPTPNIPNNKYYKRFKRYVPINRQFRIREGTQTYGNDPWIVMWGDTIGAQAGTAASSDWQSQEIMRIFFNDIHT